MKLSFALPALAVLAAVSSPVLAEEEQGAAQSAEKVAEAYIPFANHGGVRDWRADGREVIYFQDSHRRWYKAELFSSAPDLPYTLFIGLDTGVGGRLDRWSNVYISGQRYALKSFVRIEGDPPKKAKKGKKPEAEPATTDATVE
ncbi:hypothetical protein SZ64_17745 [Erythrobacter sp. SG61-1L]|uniref:DUF6491 family protein n=1 Tax=Erythrobacter sp. SG61-1L TaxID=1603897 RepID=UPI0006C90F4B|nr:DUF6491 family protein [Erythrobacter sp. SG61-1L]KPL69769.1 hypothetical protein SZ64_17700 [Erythrobacter sp. SG61-1L]KPL69778.1 hypothetical protein SZ64_17745 [Erythrobacter sp. SG61-1L]